MRGRRAEEFTVLGGLRFDVPAAQRMVAAALAAGDRPTVGVPDADWFLGDPRFPARINIDPIRAARAVLSPRAPIIVAQLVLADTLEVMPIVIDGNHRLYRAWKEHRVIHYIPLTVAQTAEIVTSVSGKYEAAAQRYLAGRRGHRGIAEVTERMAPGGIILRTDEQDGVVIAIDAEYADNAHAANVYIEVVPGTRHRRWRVLEARAEHGYGPPLYEALLQYVGRKYGGWMVSDSEDVSDDAYGVWSRYPRAGSST